MRKLLWIAMLMAGISNPALAAGGSDCWPMTVNITFIATSPVYVQAKDEIDQKLHRLEEYVRSQNIQQFELQSLTYTLLRQTQRATGYRLNGNADFLVGSSESAFKIGGFLTQQQFQVTVSSRKNIGECQANASNPASRATPQAAPAPTPLVGSQIMNNNNTQVMPPLSTQQVPATPQPATVNPVSQPRAVSP